MLYHASPVKNLKVLEPRASNQGVPRVYFSTKRENVLVYLSNAVEKYCRETKYEHHGQWYKWASYGFSKEGILTLEEYYPNATIDTYQGVSAYLYATDLLEDGQRMQDIPDAVVSDHPVAIQYCEWIPDAYEAIMEAVNNKKILLQRFEDRSKGQSDWLISTMIKEYREAEGREDYRHFLRGKFDFLKGI